MHNTNWKLVLSIFLIASCWSSSRWSSGDEPSVKSTAYQLDSSFPQQTTGLVWQATSAVATDSKGNVFVFHRGTQPILQFDQKGKLLRAFGEGLFTSAHGLRIDADDCIWVTDNANHTVVKFDPDGKVLLSLGKRDVAGEDAEHFNQPTDVAFSANGDFYISDGYGNSRVVKFDKTGKFLFGWGQKGTEPGQFNLPHAVQVDRKGEVYVGDRENNRIQVFDASGNYLRQIKGLAPYGLYLTDDQFLFVADGRANRVVKMTLDGVELVGWGKTGAEPGNFRLPHGLTVARNGAVFVTEITGKRIQKFLPPSK